MPYKEASSVYIAKILLCDMRDRLEVLSGSFFMI